MDGGSERPTTPSTMEAGIPEMFPRDADVLPTAMIVTCCCPVCGCVAISRAKKVQMSRLTEFFMFWKSGAREHELLECFFETPSAMYYK